MSLKDCFKVKQYGSEYMASDLFCFWGGIFTDITIKRAVPQEIDEGIALAEQVFDIYEAHEFTEEGVKSFKDFIYGANMGRLREKGDIIFWNACCGEKLVGTCALREKKHISLLFVHGDFHRQGIGRMLMDTACEYALKNYGQKRITVNSSPYGLLFYTAYGFKAVDMERITDGIRYTPMIYFSRE